MGTTHKVVKDFYRLLKNITSFSDGQAKILENEGSPTDPDVGEDAKFAFQVDITPNGGPYLGGTFRFKIVVENENRWPQDPPTVRCLTDIYHPNIDNFDEGEYSNVCVNALDLCTWDSQFDFETCIQSLLFLFYEPNFDDVLSLICCSDENFQELVQTSLKGGIVDGIRFKPNEGWLKKKGGGNSSQEKENEIDT